jgi:arylsulfatase A-like enzyme
VSAPGSKAWTAALVALALLFPVGWLVLPLLWPARSTMPIVRGPLNTAVLLITVPGLRADRVHHLGYERAITPALDRLAETGLSYRTCWAQSNASAPSAAALLTGRCPVRTGLLAPGDSLKPGHETLAEIFARAGHRTAAVIADPELLDAHLEQGFGTWEPRPGALAAAVVDEALRQIDAAHDEPYLLWLSFADLLVPYGGTDLPASAFAPDAPAGFGAAPGDYDLTAETLAARGFGEREVAWLDARYDAALARLDAEIGRLLDAIEARNRLNTMTVCLAGLRGERLAERPPRLFTHGVDLFDASLRVPLIFRLPAQEGRGQLNPRLAQLIDLGPTLAELALKQKWRNVTGRSLKETMQAPVQVNKAAFAQGVLQDAPGHPGRAAAAIRFGAGKGQVKAIVAPDGELLSTFRYADDPGEQRSLELRGEQITLLRKQWTTALGEQSACFPAGK